jgi:hypothetical protein
MKIGRQNPDLFQIGQEYRALDLKASVGIIAAGDMK